MSLKRLFKSVGKVVKKVLPVAASFIPGVGPFLGAGLQGLQSIPAGSGGPPPQPTFWDKYGGAIGSIGGAVATGVLGRASAKDQMRFQAGQAATAHQRELADLRAAGLNPVLSGTGGAGASSGSGAGWDMPDLGAAFMEARLNKAQLRRMEAETDNIDANTKRTNFEVSQQRKYQDLERQAGLWETRMRIRKIVQDTSSSAKDLEIKASRFKRELGDPELQQWIISEGYASQKQIDRILEGDANWSDIVPLGLRILGR